MTNRCFKYGLCWHVHGNEQMLEPWSRDPEKLRAGAVKTNSLRFIAKTAAADGETYFVKYEKNRKLPIFASHAETEFRAAERLKEKGILCAEYTAWTANRTACISVSKALPEDCVQMRRLCWETSQEKRKRILQSVCGLLYKLCRAGIRHKDLHMGNILGRRGKDGTIELYLVDLAGIRFGRPLPECPVYMLDALSEMLSFFSDTEIAGELVHAQVYAAKGLAEKKIAEFRKFLEKDIRWPKRIEQILSGHSKFATEKADGRIYRNTAWFEPADAALFEVSEPQFFDEEEGLKIWLDSFKRQLLHQKTDKIPVILEKKDGKTGISFLKDKKNAVFFGFFEK